VNQMTRDPMIGEFVGTFILVLLGDGVVAGCILKRTKAEGAGWLAITTGWAFAVLCGIFTANLFGSPDAHINPANYAELLVILQRIANTSIAEFCGSHQKQRCPQVSVQCRRIVNLYGRPLTNLRQGMDTKRALSLINSICRCGGVVWCPLSPRNRVHSSEKVELNEQSEICEIVHSA
jgi:hypothetical protein